MFELFLNHCVGPKVVCQTLRNRLFFCYLLYFIILLFCFIPGNGWSVGYRDVLSSRVSNGYFVNMKYIGHMWEYWWTKRMHHNGIISQDCLDAIHAFGKVGYPHYPGNERDRNHKMVIIRLSNIHFVHKLDSHTIPRCISRTPDYNCVRFEKSYKLWEVGVRNHFYF